MAESKTGGETAKTDESKSFLETAQGAIADAYEATVEAVKEHPVAAAAIAAGAAAAVGGAAYAASQLLGDKDATDKK
jgi:hypothetical protein